MGRQSLTALSLHDAGPSDRPPLFVAGNVADAQPALKLPSYSPQNIPLPASDFRSLIDEVADLAKNLTDASGSAIAFRKEHGTICLARSGEGAPPLGARVDGTSGICKACLESGAMLWCADVATADPEISRTAGIRAVAVAPIYCGKEISGILAVFSSTPRLFTQLQLQWLQQLADWIGSAQSLRVEKPIARRAAEATLPMRFLRDVFIETRLPWKRFIESVLLHAVVIGTLTGLSAFWPQVLPIARPPLRDVHITYYPSSQSFPARESSRPLPHPRRSKTSSQQLAEARRDSAPQETSVSRDALETRKITAPPVPDLPSIASRRFEKPAMATAVSPAPEIAGANLRRLGLPRNSVIAPPPELGGSSGLRSISAPKTAVVPPSPEISGLDGHSVPGMRGRSGLASGRAGDTVIVPPAPSVDGHAIVISRTAGFVPGSSVIAAPPTIGAGLRSNTSGRGITAGTGVAQVVPPPPSLTGTGDSLGAGRGDSLAGAAQGTQVVPPPPSLAGAGNSPGFGRGDSLAGNRASKIVPPPPSLAGTGNLLGGGRGSGLSGTGSGAQIVPPPPSMQDGGNIGGGRANSSLGRGTEVVPPPPSVAGMSTGNAGTGGRGGSLAGAPLTAALAPQPHPDIPRVDTATAAKPSTPAPDLDLSHRVFQNMQLRVIGLAWAPPRSSYFSNFEVFIAQKVVNKNETQYIKLVYVFLPYQMRLSQYGADAMRLRRIRATRDSTCDENLMDVMWPEDEGGASSRSRNTTAPQSSKRSELLPCYITNADEYTRAISRRR